MNSPVLYLDRCSL